MVQGSTAESREHASTSMADTSIGRYYAVCTATGRLYSAGGRWWMMIRCSAVQCTHLSISVLYQVPLSFTIALSYWTLDTVNCEESRETSAGSSLYPW